MARRRANKASPRGPLVLLAAAALLAGCVGLSTPQGVAPHIAATDGDVADVFVSAYPVIEWSDISSALAPKRNLTITQSDGLALPVTSALALQQAMLTQASLSLTAPKPGASAPGAPALPAASNSLPALLGASPALNSADPGAQLMASTALFQQAVILDHQITDQYLPGGYTAHVLTLQINLQPKRSDLSYNALVDITVLPSTLHDGVLGSIHMDEAFHAAVKDNASGLAPVLVRPLIVADALELGSVQNSASAQQQLIAQLAASLSAGSGWLGLNRQGNQQDQFAGFSKNSLVTDGVINEDTVRIRLGAEDTGGQHLFLTPRTYNVSLLVMTRNGAPQSQDNFSALTVLASTKFTPVDSKHGDPIQSGDTLPNKIDFDELAQSAAHTIVDQYHYQPLARECVASHNAGEIARPSDRWNFRLTYLGFLNAVDRGDYDAVKRCLNLNETRMTIIDEEKLQYLIASLSSLQAGQKFQRVVVPLPDSHLEMPDPRQLALVTPDPGDGTNVIKLLGGKNLLAPLIHARVALHGLAESYLLPTKITVTGGSDGDAEVVAITVPPPSSLSAVSSAGDKDDPASYFSRVDLYWGDPRKASEAPCGSPRHSCFDRFATVQTAASPDGKAASPSDAKSAAQSPTASSCSKVKPLSASSTNMKLVHFAGETYGVLNLVIGDLSKYSSDCGKPSFATTSPKQLSPPFQLLIANARVDLPDLATNGVSCLAQSKDTFTVASAGTTTGACMVKLKLSDFTESKPVTLNLQDANQVAVGDALSIDVVER